MCNRQLNRDQNLIGGQMAVQNWMEITTHEPLWCNTINCWTRFKFRFDPGSKFNVNDVGATCPKWIPAFELVLYTYCNMHTVHML